MPAGKELGGYSELHTYHGCLKCLHVEHIGKLVYLETFKKFKRYLYWQKKRKKEETIKCNFPCIDLVLHLYMFYIVY